MVGIPLAEGRPREPEPERIEQADVIKFAVRILPRYFYFTFLPWLWSWAG